ncbi:MAG: RHS repeat-associated core domain-containing protein [Lysobacteraceae bacterium]|nr:MAG: RHS repeat-associated core domain-containing protein [Xanthomonadaceae bacterium]
MVPSRCRRFSALLRAFLLSLTAFTATAQIQWGQAYGEKIKNRQTLGQLGPELFGEQINLFDGTASFAVTDIDIPGNNALPVRVGRKLSFGSPNNAAVESLFGNWEMDIPYLSNVSYTSYGWQAPPDPSQYWRVGGAAPYARCSGPQQQGDVATNDVPNMFVNGGNGELYLLTASTSPKLVRPTLSGVRWVTKDFWYLGCESTLASGHLGEGFWAVDPDGNKYTFNWMVRSFYPSTVTPALQSGAQIVHNRSELRLYPTLVQDRFGNWVQYQWQGRKLLSIVASDGRRIDFAYGADDQIVSATAHGKTWTYTYNDSLTAGVGGILTTATNPDNSTWTYTVGPGNYVAYEPRYELRFVTTPGGSWATQQVEIYEKVTFCSYDKYLSTAIYPFEIKHPSGARGTFNFKTMRHGRTHVPGECVFGWDDGGDGGYQDAAQNSHNLYPAFKDVWSLQSKVIQGPGLSPATWQYSYAGLEACVAQACTNNPVPTRKTVTVTDPDGSTTVSTFGKIYGEDESQLLSVERRSGASVLSRTDYGYVNNAEIGLMPFPDVIGYSATEYADDWSSGAYRPQRTTVITQQGVALTRTINSFDAFARPLSVSRYSPWYAKTESTEYHHDLGKWVIGQVKKVTHAGTGQVLSETEYNAQALPWKQYKFGKLVSILSYWPDGNLNTDTDANGHTIWLGNYHRGVPRTIGYPATPEAPEGASESAEVNNLGWITSVTDETRAKTCYDYDPMGRIASITYPAAAAIETCDDTRWNPVSLSFQQINLDEHGLPAGHWRASRYEGNKHVNTYYDALWRPVLEESLDVSDIGNTLSQVVKRFDTDGRVTFQSYPTRNVGNHWDVTQGTRTQYDALDRVTRTEQDSEHGALVTTTDYLQNFQVRVTNPRGLQTTSGHLVYDEPDYDTPVWIAEPENKVTEIVRDAYDRPITLIRRSADNSQRVERKYVYDVAGRLCKTIEPETGATWFGYDEAGNLTASSAGLSLPDANTCNWAEGVNSPRKVTRTYDARHRLKTLTFPDGRGNQVWTYEKDGLTASITTYNDPGNTTPVINAYTYNPRRLLTGESSSQPGWYTWGIGYEYDRNASQSRQTYPTGLQIDYAPNALGQPTQVRDHTNKTYASGASYYPNGALKQFTYGNGIVHTMTQNARQLPQRVSSSGGVLDYTHYYDANGNVEHIANELTPGYDLRDRWMQYDGLDRLTAAGSGSFGGDHWHRFSYDALDNLKSWKLAGVKDYAEYVYDQNNRLTNIRNTAGASVLGLAYDLQGNLSNKNGQTFEFDYGNRLRGATSKEYYRYDGHGRRVLNWRYPTPTTPNGTLSLSQYSQSGQLLFQWDDQYPKYSENLYLGGSVIAIRDIAHPTGAVTVKYQHTDALGSPTAVTSETGAVIERNDYEPWGAIIGKPAFNGIGYTGHMMDSATGLTYMQQRYYDQSIGRFLSVDPVTAYDGDYRHFNRYAYAYNSPYRFVDPDGRAGGEPGERAFAASAGLFLDDEAYEALHYAESQRPGGGVADEMAGARAVREVVNEVRNGGSVKGAVRRAALRGAEHKKNARRSTRGKHQAGQARKQRDQGGEKGDTSRRPPSRRPPGHKGPWPPKPKKPKPPTPPSPKPPRKK